MIAEAAQTRLSTLVLIRWLAVGGQLVTILVVQLAVGGLPLLPVLGAVAASAALNGVLAWPDGINRRLDETRAAQHLAFDILQLALLLGLTGGLANPFSLFLLAPVTVAAATLSARLTALLASLAVVALAVVGHWHLPLPIGAELDMPPLYRFGMGLALMMGVLSVAFFTWRMAEESRRIAAAFSQSRLALERESRVAEVGALAAAVAHELNTPLATVCLIARDLAAELDGTPWRDDIEMLIGQAERCRVTLTHLTQRSAQGEAVEGERIAFPALVELAAAPHTRDGVLVLFDHSGKQDLAAPWLERSPAILLGLGNFIQNAVQFARSRVEIDTAWDECGLVVRVADDGPGFPPHLLDSLGEPYTSVRDSDDGGHLGLGIFIATTLLARTGARFDFANQPDAGAEIIVTWPNLPGNAP